MSGYGIEVLSRTQSVGNAATDRMQIDRASSGGGIGGVGESGESENSFGSLIKNMMNDVAQTQNNADAKADELIAGRSKDIHGAMIAMEKADLSLRMLTQVRNKVIDAYKEIMHMQV